MQLGDLKKSLFGYQKESVYNYIVSLEAEIQNKYAEQVNRAESELGEARKRIEELEKKLEETEAENKALRERCNSKMLSEMDVRTEAVVKDIKTVKEKAPVQNMSLFSKKAVRSEKEIVL